MAIGIYNRYVPYERSIENIEELFFNDESLLEGEEDRMSEVRMVEIEEDLCPKPYFLPIIEGE